jgi:hypothetical protein
MGAILDQRVEPLTLLIAELDDVLASGFLFRSNAVSPKRSSQR